MARWREETHGPGFELLRHFLARFFDSEMVTTAGEWQKVAIGTFAALFSAGILVLKTYMLRYTLDLYAQPAGSDIGQIYRHWVRGDILSFIGLAMAVTALLTVLLWHSLFPGTRDCLALAGLPVSARQVFQAKYVALLLLFGAYVAALNVPPAVAFASAISGPWQENPSGMAIMAATFSATAGACVFVFFSLLAIQGILLNLLPGRIFANVSLVVQAALFIVTLGSLPLLSRQPAGAAWWPPVWFLRFWEAMVAGPGGSARSALLAITVPPVVATLAYLLSYHRYRRLLLEAPPDRAAGKAAIGSWLLERWIGSPREQAAFAFIWKALARSRSHRLILLAYAGIALGWIVNGVVETPRPSLRDQGMYGLLVVLAPLGLAMLVTVGLRYVFSLPVALGANWVFRTADEEGRAPWLAAVERFVVWCGVAPVLAANLPVMIAVLGWVRAPAATALAFLAALLWFETMFRHWRKLPFTCSYLPGKRPVWVTLLRYSLAIPLLPLAGKVILHSSGDLTAFVALVSFLAVWWWRLRTARRAMWSRCALVYEEVPEGAVMALDLQPEREPGQGIAPAAAQPAADMFAGSLVASRSRLPQAWVEEIQEDRRHPSLLLETFLEDVRYGARLICRSPLFSCVVILTLMVGIGINTSVFTVFNAFALRPHVYREPGTFVRVIPKARLRDEARRASHGEYIAFRDRSRSLRHLAAWTPFPAFIGGDSAAVSTGIATTCNFFAVDGTDRPVLGRLFSPDDCRASGGVSAALIGESYWRARFASDPGIVGRVLDLNNRPVHIVGILPRRAANWIQSRGWSDNPAIWLPYTAAPYFEPSGDPFQEDHLWLFLAGRLAPGFSRSDAEAELNILARQQDLRNPGRNTAITTTDGSWIEELEVTMTGRDLLLMSFFLGSFNLVLFISCANVATLLLARAASRRREIAVRLSLGAPRIRLVRMLVTESLLLASVAGAASIYLAWHVPRPMFQLVAGRVPDFPMPPDWRTFAYVAGVVLLTGILAGLAPALESVKVDITASLKGAGALRPIGRRRLEGWLVSAQVAMSMALLVAAALFAQAEHRTLRADPGYLADRVVVAPMFFPDNITAATAAVKLAQVAQRVRALPGVRSVAFSEGLPLFDHATVELRPPLRPDATQAVDIYTASPGFFHTLGVRLVRGRELEPFETASVVISQSLAWAFWPRLDPIGRALAVSGRKLTVVGVVRNIDPLRFGGSENPALYRPWLLHPIRNVMSVRFDSATSAGAAAVRAAIRETEPNMLGMAIVAQQWIDRMTGELWNMVGFIVLLGAVATLLATSGIYGAVSFAVNRRTKELGIRMALGARKPDIIREVFCSGGKWVVQGLLAGLWLSVVIAAALRQAFHGSPIRLDSNNPLLYCGAAVLLLSAALLAMVSPARRGARSDPLDALRCE